MTYRSDYLYKYTCGCILVYDYTASICSSDCVVVSHAIFRCDALRPNNFHPIGKHKHANTILIASPGKNGTYTYQ